LLHEDPDSSASNPAIDWQWYSPNKRAPIRTQVLEGPEPVIKKSYHSRQHPFQFHSYELISSSSYQQAQEATSPEAAANSLSLLKKKSSSKFVLMEVEPNPEFTFKRSTPVAFKKCSLESQITHFSTGAKRTPRKLKKKAIRWHNILPDGNQSLHLPQSPEQAPPS
jgi:hypothetical protein